MAAFNPAAAAAAAFNAQLLAASQPSTPVKTEPPSTMVGAVPVAATSMNTSNAGDLGAGSDTTRFLNASGPLLTPGGLAGFPHPAMEHEAAFRAAVAQGALPFPGIYPGLHPAELKPEMMGAVRAVPSFFIDPMSYHPYASGLDGARRKNATRETTAPLKSWLNEHRKNPYPTKADKLMLALLTRMTLTQVSTWFANARRRLKKENKMTWSPRNRPGEDDDDDLADIDASSDRNHSDRPSSSASDGDISVAAASDPIQQDHSSGDVHSKSTASPPPCSETGSNPSRLSESAVSAPRRAKIWSIAETLSNRAAEANRSSSNKEDHERASTSAGEGKSSDDGRESIPPLNTAATGMGPSMISTGPPTLLAPGVPAIPAVNGQIPHHFLHFNAWQQQQQQLAMAMAARMPFPRPELLAMMAQAGQLRLPMIFNPMGFMGVPPQTPPPPVPPPAAAPLPAVLSSSPSTSEQNGASSSSGDYPPERTPHVEVRNKALRLLLPPSDGPIPQWRTPKSSTASPVAPSVISPTATTNNGIRTAAISNSSSSSGDKNASSNGNTESDDKSRENMSS